MIRPSRRDDKTEHKYYEERLSAYLDGELAARERRAVEQHLKGCERCRWEVATLKQTVAWLSEMPVVPVPRAFTVPANVVPAPPVRRPRWSWVPAVQFATAMVAVLLFFAAAGDVMLTGWPWTTAAEPKMMQEVSTERTIVDRPTAKEGEMALEVEAPAAAEAYGAGDAAATEPALAAPAPAAEAPGAEAIEEAPLAMQQAVPEAESRGVPPTEPAIGAVGEGAGGQEQAAEDVARIEADTLPVEPPAPEPEATAMPEASPTASPAPLPTTTPVPEAVIVPTPTALPALHPPATGAIEPPVALVQASEPLPPSQDVRDETLALSPGETGWAVFWLRVVEYVLGVALVVLAGATIVMMVWRRRVRGR